MEIEIDKLKAQLEELKPEMRRRFAADKTGETNGRNPAHRVKYDDFSL